MKALPRVLSAEILKLKRTNALRMVIIAPLAVIALVTFLVGNVTTLILNQRIELWQSLTRITLIFWSILMMPLYVTLETALVAGVDHAENHWKILITRPVPRWTFYTVKLFVVGAMTLLSMAILVCGLVAAGLILPKLQHDLHFATVIPIRQIIQKASEVFGLAFLLLAIQHWVSLRWRSFTVSVSFGIVGMVVGYGMLFTARGGSPGFAIYCPWSFPMMALVNPPANVTPLLWISLALGVAWSVAGCWDFSRRDVE
jgi:ABC-2 type transport system permease protein